MRVKVYAPAFLNHDCLDAQGYLEMAEGARLRHALDALRVPLVLRPVLLCTLNYERVKLSTHLKDGDVVSIIAPISGG